MTARDETKGVAIGETALRFVRRLAAPPHTVWEFLTDTTRLPQWHGEGAIEPREGGQATLLDGHVRGVVTGWRPAQFLAYSWNVFQPGESVSAWPISYLEFSLEAEETGTRLTLTHRPIPPAMQSQSMMGWHTMLDLVEAGLKGVFPPRADLFAKNAALYGVDLSNLQR
jgi:uncharacterized protein YndB with AHSA1/START domain